MRALALDATTRQGSVALVENERVVEERPGDRSRSHAERLPSELLAVVESCGLGLDDIDLFAVASGPGSFTGLRIGIATIQGLAFVLHRPVVAVSTLDAVAHLVAAGAAPGRLLGAWIDAQRGEVFTALYRTADTAAFTPERLMMLEEASVGEPAATLVRWSRFGSGGDLVVAGDGVVKYGDVLRAAGIGDLRAPPTLAGAIGRLAIVQAGRGEAIAPGAVRPHYVRRPDAEVDREKRAAEARPEQGTPLRGSAAGD